MVNSGGQEEGNSEPVAPVYSRHPGKVAVGIINFSTKPGWNHWKMATEQVQKEPYYCKPEGFYQFMQNLKIRASLIGWSAPNGILNIAPSYDHPSKKKQLLNDYGVFSYERIVEHEKSYIFAHLRITLCCTLA